jgi:hypothetical protein
MSAPKNAHIPIIQLWEYSRDPEERSLPDAEWEHLQICVDCIVLLSRCINADSIEHIRPQ